MKTRRVSPSLSLLLLLVLSPQTCFGGRERDGHRRRRGGIGRKRPPLFENFGQRGHVCSRSDRFVVAVRCQDSTELFYCPPSRLQSHTLRARAGYERKAPDLCADGSIFEHWADQWTCQRNGGFQEILPYYTGCYPKDVNFWQSFAPELDIKRPAEIYSKITGHPVPPLNVANADFEDPEMGISEWVQIVHGEDYYVRQKNDDFPRCESKGMCLAYNGTGFALISAGSSMEGVTTPNSISRDDLRIPAVDTNVCRTEVKFCLSFAMRFINKEIDPYPSETGNDDFFTVEVQMGGDGEMLFNKTIRSTDVEGLGDNTGKQRLGDDGGWELVEIELPEVSLGESNFFAFRAMSINVGDRALDSVGYIDSLNIARCAKYNLV